MTRKTKNYASLSPNSVKVPGAGEAHLSPYYALPPPDLSSQTGLTDAGWTHSKKGEEGRGLASTGTPGPGMVHMAPLMFHRWQPHHCSQLTAREAGKGHPVGSQRLAIILLLWKKKEGLCWTAHGLCHIHQNAHMAMIAKWGYGYFYFLLYIGIGIFLTFLYCPRGVYKITVMVIILGSWSQTAWRQISLTNWVSWDQWLPLHDSPFSSTVSRGTVVEPTSWAVVRIEAVKTYNMATVTVGKLNWVPLALP